MQKILIGNEYPKNVIELIKQAKNKIDIVIFDWRWYFHDIGCSIQQFNQALFSASERGVKVNVIVNTDQVSKFIRDSKINIKRLATSKLVHVKLSLFDEKIAVLGSHNFTKNAFESNYEMSMITDDREAVARCQQFFNTLFF